MKQRLILLCVSFIGVVLTACGGTEVASPTANAPATVAETPVVAETETPAPVAQTTSTETTEEGIVTNSGLRFIEITPGEGENPKPGDIVLVHYTGTLTDGTKFDSSVDRNEPFKFRLGRGEVIPGWDEGIAMLKPGGKAKLVIPPDLAYGERGAGGAIPPNATLLFEVELITVTAGSPPPPEAPTEVDEADYITSPTGLKYYDMVEGEGDAATADHRVTLNYTGWLTDGTRFDSSFDTDTPIGFVLGRKQIIPGWDEGILGMKVGGKRQLVIPASLAYGDRGAGNVIPPGATLIFDVELLELKELPPPSPAAPTTVKDSDFITTASGLKYYDMAEGTGAIAQTGQKVSVHYTGWLTDGTKFDSSLDRGEPFAFTLGKGEVIPGWDEGVANMKVGGKRQLQIPAILAYGEVGAGGVIPPGATLVFEVELLEIKP